MQDLTTDLVGKACTIFLGLAYPGGEGTIPAKRRLYLALPPGRLLADLLADSAEARVLCQAVKDGQGRAVGCAIRLGSADFPHLKLRVQQPAGSEPGPWVFGVDTHDAFCADRLRAPADHPEAEAWTRLQTANRRLKEQIERAWDEAGLLTFNGLLRRALEQADGSPA
jgi:hypothetical protein